MKAPHPHPFAELAEYTTSPIPRFRGNPLIEALPESPDDQELHDSMYEPLNFKPEERAWKTLDRTFQIDGLSKFSQPTNRQLELCYALERMIRSGYVGRVPNTPQRARINQRVLELERAGAGFRRSESDPEQCSAALIGISGMGKTTTLKRWRRRMKQVIYHPEYNAYQVPVLHIEMPPKGASIKALAISIFMAFDKLLPGNNYTVEYTRGKPGDDVLILMAAKLILEHNVGLLICDELQRLCNAPVGSTALMEQLVFICNVFEVPVLLVGTTKASKLLDKELTKARRSSGGGISPWDRLRPIERGGDGEWEEFVKALWEYQWVRNPVELDKEGTLSNMLYWGSQGIIDLAIKLFKCTQIRAMGDGSETITVELMGTIYKEQFKPVHHMLDAIRLDRPALLAQYDDVSLLDFDAHLKRMQAKERARASDTFAVKSNETAFTVSVASSLALLGHPLELAEQAVQHVIDEQPHLNMQQAAQAAMKYLEVPKRARSKRSPAGSPAGKVIEKADPRRFDAREHDYRRAIAHAEGDGVPVLEMFNRLGMALPVEHILSI